MAGTVSSALRTYKNTVLVYLHWYIYLYTIFIITHRIFWGGIVDNVIDYRKKYCIILTIYFPILNKGALKMQRDFRYLKDKYGDVGMIFLWEFFNLWLTITNANILLMEYLGFIPHECIIYEFDSDQKSSLPQGLIDDAVWFLIKKECYSSYIRSCVLSIYYVDWDKTLFKCTKKYLSQLI